MRATGSSRKLEALNILEAKDVSKAPGIVHARHSLLEDASYDWNTNLVGQAQDKNRDYFAVRFSREHAVTTVVFLDSSFERVLYWEGGQEAALSPKTRDGWKQFVSRYFLDAVPARKPPAKSK